MNEYNIIAVSHHLVALPYFFQPTVPYTYLGALKNLPVAFLHHCIE
jgi:hypothetical protein